MPYPREIHRTIQKGKRSGTRHVGAYRCATMGCGQRIRKGIKNRQKNTEMRRVQEKIFQDIIEEGSGDGHSDGGDSDDEFKTKQTVEFKDMKTMEYQEIVAQGGKLSKLSTSTSYHTIYDQISDSDDDDDDDDGDSDGDSGDDIVHVRTADEPTKKPQPSSNHRQLEEVDIDDI